MYILGAPGFSNHQGIKSSNLLIRTQTRKKKLQLSFWLKVVEAHDRLTRGLPKSTPPTFKHDDFKPSVQFSGLGLEAL